MPKRKNPIYKLQLAALMASILIVAVTIYAAVRFHYIKAISRLDKDISGLLNSYAITKSHTVILREYYVGKQLDMGRIEAKLRKLFENRGFKLLGYETVVESGKNCRIFKIGRQYTDKVLYILKLIDVRWPPKARIIWKRPPAKISIIIDDWGYNTNNMQLLDSIDMPLTISILPSLTYSNKIAASQHLRRNREIILHMPMEPEDKSVRLERNTLLSSMSQKEITDLLNSSLKTVPHAKGISNHMGSKATQDRPLIEAVMRELKRAGLYFLDSIATPNSICEEEAKRLKVRFIKRDVFLDNVTDRKYISHQLDKLIRLARQKGYAVGIGHDRPLTLQVLKERLGQLMDDERLKVVLASELTK